MTRCSCSRRAASVWTISSPSRPRCLPPTSARTQRPSCSGPRTSCTSRSTRSPTETTTMTRRAGACSNTEHATLITLHSAVVHRGFSRSQRAKPSTRAKKITVTAASSAQSKPGILHRILLSGARTLQVPCIRRQEDLQPLSAVRHNRVAQQPSAPPEGAGGAGRAVLQHLCAHQPGHAGV